MLTAAYVQTNLVSNIRRMALKYDQFLVNPWGVNSPQDSHNDSPVVVADQGSGAATSYQISRDGSKVTVDPSPTVTFPTASSTEPSGPTGVVQNKHGHLDFLIEVHHRKNFSLIRPATYIFDTLQGTIVGSYSNGKTTSAKIVVDNSLTGAEYTGLAAGSFDGQDYIYAANDGTNPGIQVFNSSFQQMTLGSFIDPCLPAGFIPFGVRDLSLGDPGNSNLFITYRGPNFQGGAVAEFTNDGRFLTQIATDATESNLQSPWGLAFIKKGFGQFSGDLLVGNFSSGQIDAYSIPSDPSLPRQTWSLAGTVDNTNGTPLTIPGLRSIHFGAGLGASGKTHVGLIFTAETTIPLGNFSLYGEVTPANVKLPMGVATGTVESAISSK